jgi:hypothetical protein
MFDEQNCKRGAFMRVSVVILLIWAIPAVAQFPDFTPPTPLFRAAMRNDLTEVKRLLDAGSDPNEGTFQGFSPIFLPVMYQNLDMLRVMVAKGGDVNSRDRVGSTLLMWAAFNEEGKTELVSELLKLGADPNIKNKSGETALTWAMRRGQTPVVDLLKKSGASDAQMIKDSVEKAISLLQKSGAQFSKVSGCTSCHHQFVPQMAVGVARERGFAVDDQISSEQVNAVIRMFEPVREAMAQGTERIPDPTISVSYALIGLAAEGHKPDALTASMAHLIATQQRSDGSFRAFPARPPLESNDFAATALCIRSLQLYGDHPDESVRRAVQWLRLAHPYGNQDRAMQLMGLTWGKADPEDLRSVANALLAEQQADGAWSQLPGLETDAHATGQALVALAWSGQVHVSDPAYQRGVAFLLRTQGADGSWHVRTRSYPVQPYRESGFPYGKDQWISAVGTSWASMAIALTAPRVDPNAANSDGNRKGAGQ